MTWYRAVYGSWNDTNGVRYLKGSFDKKDIFARAQETANKTGLIVTVSAEHGMNLNIIKVYPQK